MSRSAEWVETDLGSCVDLLAGFAFKSDRFSEDPADIPLVKGENLQQGYVDWGRAKRWPLSECRSYEKFSLRPGDVVLAMDRPWVDAGLKWAFIGPRDPSSLLVQRVARLRAKEGVSEGFVRAIVGSLAFSDYVQPIVTGVNVPHISGDQIRSFRIQLPPFPIQCMIAAIVAAYDDLIENNHRRIRILEDMARALYREWFIEFRFPGHEKVRLVQSPLGRIPEGWPIVNATDAIEVNPRVAVSTAGPNPFVPMSALSENSMLISGVEERASKAGSKFQNGDTLFARITPCLENGKTGFVQFLPSSSDAAIGSTEFIVLRSRTLSPEVVYLLARSDPFRDNAIKSMSGATGRQRVQEKCFESFLLAHPNPDLIGRFSAITQPLFRAIFFLSKKNNVLRRTRDLLLPRLISGELDVAGLDIAVPEAVS